MDNAPNLSLGGQDSQVPIINEPKKIDLAMDTQGRVEKISSL